MSVHPEQLTEHVLGLIRDCAQLGEDDALASDTSLADAGVDSMALVELLVRVEDELGVVFPDELLTPETFESAETIAHAVAGLLREQMP